MTENEMLEQLTLEEKAALCTGDSAWTTTAIARLGIAEMVVSDGPHGLRRLKDVHTMASQSLPATCFPTAACVASTWDAALIHRMGQAIAAEAIALNVDIVLGPGVNMKRTPLCGRNFEYWSEDPFLAGNLAASYINGVQSQGVGTSLKHFAANNQEYQRFTINAEIDERALREIYLPAFETAVKQAKPWSVMCAYNKLNGTLCSENEQLLTDILKKEWGFEGLVVSDWGAVRERVAALRAGLDWAMPGPNPRYTQAIIDAVRSGELPETVLNEAVRRILRIMNMAHQTPKQGAFDIAAHHALARQIAADGMVLLKNNGLLPLAQPQHIAIIGKAAQTPQYQGGGSSNVNPTQVEIPYVELQKLADHAELAFAEGYLSSDEFAPSLIEQATQVAASADVAVIIIALPTSKESEGYDRPDMDLTQQQLALINAVSAAQPNCVVVLDTGSAVTLTDWSNNVAAILYGGLAGQASGGALADVLFGRVNPSGKLTETFPIRLSDTPAYINYPGDNGTVRYGEGLFIGYRYYDAKHVPVQFPFGFGLSYTTFEYSNAQVSAQVFTDTLTVSVDITNSGNIAGKEIVQIYVHDQKSRLVRPIKELKGFAKVELQPGQTQTVHIQLDQRAFAYYDPAYKTWVAESGEFDILIGASSADIRCVKTVTLQSQQMLPCILNRDSTVRDWQNDPRGQQASAQTIPLIISQLMQSFGMSENSENAIGMDPMAFIGDMPLLKLLQFREAALPKPATEIVDELIRQAIDYPLAP
ncbi:MAG: glycoside hydrolase family 3 C-terminal domain-containing protein [Anaerolineae bacterium]|nr:glycoside hydrolase family 3 C-terminal domain-containing protein [Anaerolineae bacterium]